MQGLHNTISSQRAVPVGLGSASFIEAIPNRVALIISAPSAASITLSLEKIATLLGAGITIHMGRDPLILTLQEHGDLVTRAWSAIGGGVEAISVVETFSKT